MKKIYFMILMAFAINIQSFANLSILIVNDNGYDLDRIEVVKTAVTNAGYIYSYFDAATLETSPTFEEMNEYDLVIWYTGNDSSGLLLWDGDETDNEALIEYLDNGGMLWLSGLDFLYDRYAETPWDFVAGEFVYDYLGISQYFGQSHIDDGLYSDGVPQLDVVEGNGIFTLNPILWTYATLWYADAVLPVNMENGGNYKMGPTGYDLDNYYSVVYNEIGDAKVLSMTIETARLDSQENTDAFFTEALDYFSQFGSGSGIAVESVTVYGQDGATSIEENGGTLQMIAEVLPEDATNMEVSWSVINGTAYASITDDGLLMASGTSIGNGNCWVKATSTDGTGITDSVEVTISNQVNNPEFEILLVNDNANGTDRYLVLDTTLLNLNYNYNIYNTLETLEAPSFALLSAYDLVIWYTGNDGVDLKLWDVSDTNNYKFNEDLMNYVEAKGNVWVQGLDFMYDVFGSAPDSFEAGQFIYDVMGISKYAAQSRADDNEIGLPQLDVVDGNGISTFTPMKWVFETLWYADGFELSPNATAMYQMGPAGYPLDMYYSGLYTNNPGYGYIMTWAIETARIDTRDNTEEIFDEVLSYIEENHGTGIQEWTSSTFSIEPIYPNPTTEIATLEYQLETNAQVQFSIFDITGRMISSINRGTQNQGTHQFQINKTKLNLESGIYLYTIKIDKQQFTGKIVLK